MITMSPLRAHAEELLEASGTQSLRANDDLKKRVVGRVAPSPLRTAATTGNSTSTTVRNPTHADARVVVMENPAKLLSLYHSTASKGKKAKTQAPMHIRRSAFTNEEEEGEEEETVGIDSVNLS